MWNNYWWYKKDKRTFREIMEDWIAQQETIIDHPEGTIIIDSTCRDADPGSELSPSLPSGLDQ